jgi:hypothetical protein
MRVHDDGRTVAALDVLVPGIGENHRRIAAFSVWPGGCAFNKAAASAEAKEIIEIGTQPNDRISTAPQLSRRLLCAGWFPCFLRPRVLERDRPVEREALRRTVFVQGEVAEALKLIPGFASRLPQAWLASSCNDFE